MTRNDGLPPLYQRVDFRVGESARVGEFFRRLADLREIAHVLFREMTA